MTDILFVHNLKDVIKESAYQYFRDKEVASEDVVYYITDLLQDPNQVPQEYLAFDEPAALILAEAAEREQKNEDAYTVYKHLADASILNSSLFRDALNEHMEPEYYDDIGKMSCLKAGKKTNHNVFQDIFLEIHNYYDRITYEIRQYWKTEITDNRDW